MQLRLNISPCPNDTFMFDALANGRIDTGNYRFRLEMDDIERLNARVLRGEPHVSKISCAILPLIWQSYGLLRSGAALGRGNGPLLVAREQTELSGALKVAVPGEHTTANRLMSRLYPHIVDKTSLLFSQIAEAVAQGEFDAGALIHEGRFTYGRLGLTLLADLGAEWERVTGLPLPLGGIVVSRELLPRVQHDVQELVGRSVAYALAHRDASREFVRAHARELSDEVTQQHINMFVNDFSLDVGPDGQRALRELTGLASENIFIDSL
ncbi:1,4-dihydroxy-6-naphtoate synthase [Bacteroidia bacterium]|nr:1,4-dihydroxy-6-naphtoate synthase [Bacteroidia bacterium]